MVVLDKGATILRAQRRCATLIACRSVHFQAELPRGSHAFPCRVAKAVMAPLYTAMHKIISY